MYYSYTCSHCSKVFYTYSDDKDLAAKTIYAGIEAHMKDFSEEEDASFFHESEEDTNRIYGDMAEASTAPSGGYQL